MVIEAIGPNTVKITLRKSDMDRFGLKYETLSRDSFETKLLLSSLISVISAEETIKFSSDRLYIEAFEQPGGSCIIYISSIPEKTEVRLKSGSTADRFLSFTFEINDTEKLKSSISELSVLPIENIKRSKLYENNGCYRLVLEAQKKYEKRLFKFAEKMSVGFLTDEITASVTDEHWQCLIPEKAVEELNRKLIEAD